MKTTGFIHYRFITLQKVFNDIENILYTQNLCLSYLDFRLRNTLFQIQTRSTQIENKNIKG